MIMENISSATQIVTPHFPIRKNEKENIILTNSTYCEQKELLITIFYNIKKSGGK